MAKQLNQVDVNLAFNADTKKAQQEMNKLFQSLRNLSTFSGSSSSIFNAKEMQEASKAARELEQHLRAATDMNTGKLNLSAFSASLKASGKDLDSYRKTLENIGPAGEAAFLKVSKSIALADAPMRKTNKLLKEFSTTMKNTVRWQFSSSLLHGFMGTLQSAYGYAQDLNESLNNIRIVTGQNIGQMEAFAQKANKAAQALSTTTKTYTDAALIFYQQGLSDKAVEERTNTTIKMANVTKDGATEVSSYMTAIWNNFDDGSESLEHYADVITALGAATASSSSEIAGGLEKFAAIGKQIGLSYEYATAALATVVAQTRQSEDVVGTAFKTIFARIQGLNLGETLDDGTDLNKYSKALQTVGVDIKDVNGQVKDMNVILDELGAKWKTLSKDTQIATAQTVAGVRQYNQLIALMDNWDTFKQNVNIADNSDGTLEEQAEIYAESWEASRKRVKAALEDIYDTLLNDEFFIKLNNGFATLLKGVKGFIDGFGGMKGILFTLSGFIAQKLAREAPAALEHIKQNLMQITGQAQKLADKEQKKNISWLQKESTESMQTFEEGQGSLAYTADVQITEMIAEQKNKLIQYENEYSQAEKAAAEQEIEHLQSIQGLLVQQGQRYDELSSKSNALEADIEDLGRDYSIAFKGEQGVGMADFTAKLRDVVKTASGLKIAQKEFKNLDNAIEDNKDDVTVLAKNYSNLAKHMAKSTSGQAKTEWNNLSQALASASKNADLTADQFKEIVKNSEAFKNIESNLNGAEQEIKDMSAAMQQCEDVPNVKIKEFIATLREMGVISTQVPMSLDNTRDSMENIKQHASSGSEAIMSFSGALMQANAFISSMTSLGEVFSNEDSTTIEKIGAAIGAVTSAFALFNSISQVTKTLMALETAQHKQAAIAGFLHAAAGNAEAKAELAKTHPKLANIAATIAQTVANWGLNASMAPLLIVTLALTAAILLLVGTITAVVAAFKAISNAYNADAIAAQKAAEAAKELKNQYEETKQAYDDMISHMEKYQSAREGLESLTKGTEEYREALQEANRAALDMLASSDKFTSEDYHWENGELIINEDAMNRVKKEMAQDEAESYAALQMANINASRAKAKSDTTDFKRSSRDDMGIGDADIFWKTAGVSLLGSLVPGLGTVAAGVYAGNKVAEATRYDNAVDKILSAMEDGDTNLLAGNMEEFTKSMNDLGIKDNELIDALYDNRESLEDLGKDLNNIAEQEKLAAQNAAEEIMANTTIGNTTEGQMAMEAGGEMYQTLYDKALKKYEDIDMANFWGVGTDEGKAMWKEYAKQTGISSKDGYKVTNYRKDGGVDYEYIDENGEKQKASATKEMITQTLAAADAAGQLEESMMELKKEIGELDSSSKASDQALAGFLSTGNFEGSTKGQFDDLQNELANMTDSNGNAVTDLDSQIGWYLDKQFGDGEDGKISDETAQKYGYESAEKMKEAFKKGLEVDFEIPEGIGDEIGNQLTLGASKSMSKNLEKMGEEGGQAYLDTMKTLSESIDLDALTPQEQTQMWNEIAAIDSAAWDAGKQYAEVIERYGGSVDMTTDAWKNNIAAMRDAGNAVPDMTQLKADMEAIKDIVDDLDIGGILSPEDYELLVAYNSELAKYFTILSDGSAQLTGDILDFQQEAKQINQENLREAVRAQNDLAEELNAQYNAGNKAVGGEGKLNQYRDTENYVGDDGNNYYSGYNVKDRQIAFLQSQGYDQEKINEWLNDLSDGSTTTDVLEEIAKAVDETATSFEGLDEQAELALAQAQKGMNELALSAEDAAERAKMLENGDINVGAYGKAFESAHNAEKWEDMDPDEVESYAKALQKAAKSSDLLDKSLENNAEAAEDVALYTKKMNRGIEKLADGFEDWSDVLNKSDESSEEYISAMDDMKDAMSDVLGVSEEFLSDSFIKENLEDIKLAAEGDADAIDRLAIAAGRDIILNIGIEDEGIRDEVLALHDSLAAQIPDIKVGATVDDADFLAKAEQIIRDSQMTMEEANAYFRSIGFEPEFTETTIQEPLMGTKTTTSNVEVDSAPTGEGGNGKFYYIKSSVTTTEPFPTGETQDIKVPALSTDGEAPKIKLTRTNAGANNNYSSSNSGGKKPGKSGGDKAKDPKKIDHKTNENPEVDRYHVITEQLERLNAELDKISKAKDRAFGAKKLKLMDEEIAKQEELIKKNQEYADMLKNNRDSEMEQLKKLGAQFDDKGVITNYNELIKKNQADYSKYNSGVDYYNSLDAEAQENLDKQYQGMTDTDGNYYGGYQDYLQKVFGDTADKQQEEFEKLLEQYESDQETYEQIMQEIQDAKDAIFDEKLEKISYVVDVKLDVDDSDIKYLEFLLTELEDKDFHAAEAIANIGLQTGKSLDKIKQYEKGIEDILKLSGYEGGIEGLKSGDISLEELQEGGLTEEGLAKLQEYIDGLAEENEALRAMRENAWAQVSDEFDEYIEKMDNGIEKIEHLKNITQSYQNIVDIVGKKYLGVSNDLVDKMNKSMVSQSQDLLKANKAKLEATQASYDKLMSEDTSGWSDQALKERQVLLDKMEDELQNAKEAFMSSWEEALQASADRYAAAVDNIIEEFSDKIAGLYGSLSELQEAYDRASDLDSQYLEDYEQIYQLSKLTRDINNSIDDTDNIAAKEEYKALLEEINQIEADGTKLSEYDLEVLQKKFELKQAQIALEEAQNAKSSVGMVRGEDGNYSYVYTANDDDVANAEQNYEDKLHEMQVLNGDYINSLQEQIIQTQQECADALAAIKESDFNSYEEWREAVDRTQAYYDQKMDFYYSQLDGALGNNRELYENDWARYSELTGYKISSDENYVDKFEETNYSILTGYTTLEEAHSAWTVATGEMLTDLATAYNEWQIDVETAMGLAGTSVDGFAEQMEQDTDCNVQDSQEAAEAVVDMGQQMEETFSETLSAIANWEAEWGSAIDDAIAKNLELIQSFNDMKREMADAMDAVSSYNPGGDSGSGNGSGGGGSNSGGDSGGSGSGGANNADKVEGVAAAIWMDGGSTSGWYNGSDRQSRLKEKGVTGAQAYINAHGPNGDIYAAWNKKRNQLKSFYYGSFDTGGYTGDWGDKSGRLALLHSKEIVLNAKDTENFLQAIDMVREISGRIDLNAKYATAMMDMMQPTIGRGGAPEIVQNIEINADFPDATDHSEIEMAFNNLINTASQYANRVR